MISEVLKRYLEIFPEDRKKLNILLNLVVSDKSPHRSNPESHITGAAIVFSPDLKRVLVVHHKALDKWLQPGGHWERGEAGPWRTAVREAGEETGVQFARRLNIDPDDERIPVLIESHLVPSNPLKREAEHYHHDFKYGLVAKSLNFKIRPEELKGVKWQELENLKVPSINNAVSRLKPLLKA